MPTDYDKSRRIGSILTDASVLITGFTQLGDDFLWDTLPVDVNQGAPGTSARTKSRASEALPSGK